MRLARSCGAAAPENCNQVTHSFCADSSFNACGGVVMVGVAIVYVLLHGVHTHVGGKWASCQICICLCQSWQMMRQQIPSKECKTVLDQQSVLDALIHHGLINRLTVLIQGHSFFCNQLAYALKRGVSQQSQSCADRMHKAVLKADADYS